MASYTSGFGLEFFFNIFFVSVQVLLQASQRDSEALKCQVLTCWRLNCCMHKVYHLPNSAKTKTPLNVCPPYNLPGAARRFFFEVKKIKGGGGRPTMASATSESYCSHLRGQLKEWERAFRSRNGRFPKQPDYEALESDGSARGRLVHGAYLALNRATGDSFTKVGSSPSTPPVEAEGWLLRVSSVNAINGLQFTDSTPSVSLGSPLPRFNGRRKESLRAAASVASGFGALLRVALRGVALRSGVSFVCRVC